VEGGFAGTETATDAHGAVEGAVRSGERAAHEVLARRSPASDHAPAQDAAVRVGRGGGRFATHASASIGCSCARSGSF
jgi:hypothetical protein